MSISKRIHYLNNPKKHVTMHYDSEIEQHIDPDKYDLRVDPEDDIIYRYELDKTTFARKDNIKTCLLTVILGDAVMLEQAEGFTDFTSESLRKLTNIKNTFDDRNFIINAPYFKHSSVPLKFSEKDYIFLKKEILNKKANIIIESERQGKGKRPYLNYPGSRSQKLRINLPQLIGERILEDEEKKLKNYVTRTLTNNIFDLRRENISVTSHAHSQFKGVRKKNNRFETYIKAEDRTLSSIISTSETVAAIQYDLMHACIRGGNFKAQDINFPELAKIYQKEALTPLKYNNPKFRQHIYETASILSLYLQEKGELFYNDDYLYISESQKEESNFFHIDGNHKNCLSSNLSKTPIQINHKGLATRGKSRMFRATINDSGKTRDIGQISSHTPLKLYIAYDLYTTWQRNVAQNFPCLKHIYQDAISDLTLPDMEKETRKAFMATLESLAQTIIDIYFPADYEPSN